jgi:hypothetical protein
MYAEIKSRFKSENACYHSVQNRLSSCAVHENVQNKNLEDLGVNGYSTKRMGARGVD